MRVFDNSRWGWLWRKKADGFSITERHLRHWQMCNCLSDACICCVPTCPCHVSDNDGPES